MVNLNTCINCGNEKNSALSSCSQCGEPLNAGITEATGYKGSDIPVNSAIAYGSGFWIRALARFIDLLYSYLLSYGAGIIFSLIMFLFGRVEVIENLQARSDLIVKVGAIGGGIIYHSICESLYSATIGKLFCGLRVVSVDGEPCGFRAALIRNIIYPVDAFFFGLVGYMAMSRDSLNQRHGDRFANTVVVKSNQIPETSRRPPGLILLAWPLASLSYMFIVSLALWVTGN